MKNICGRSVLLASAPFSAGCVSANVPQNCGADQTYGTTLAIQDAHDLSNHYDVFALMVTTDTSRVAQAKSVESSGWAICLNIRRTCVAERFPVGHFDAG